MISNICLLLSCLCTVQCPVLSSPANGEVTVTGQMIGDTATYTCDIEFEFLNHTHGSDVRTCQPDGSWTLPEPQCACKSYIILLYPDDDNRA